MYRPEGCIEMGEGDRQGRDRSCFLQRGIVRCAGWRCLGRRHRCEEGCWRLLEREERKGQNCHLVLIVLVALSRVCMSPSRESVTWLMDGGAGLVEAMRLSYVTM